MSTAPFDTLGYFGKLKATGFTEEQARVQAELLRDTLEKYDESSRRELVTRSDIQDIRLEMKSMELRLLKWQIGLTLAIIAVMAKGFGWLGF